MSDTMLHGVLNMPPEIWRDDEIDKMQRYSRYRQASRRIEDDEREIDSLRSALRLVMACAGDIDKATDADLEAALECGDAETERQANAWLVARAALRPNV